MGRVRAAFMARAWRVLGVCASREDRVSYGLVDAHMIMHDRVATNYINRGRVPGL